MAKSERILQLMQLLRLLPPPVQAAQLSAELGVSLRTVYRDVDSLRRAGAIIDGAAGFGYTLVEDTAMPPMLFNTDETEALVLGLREVIEIGDPVLADAARNALAKLAASLPDRLSRQMQNSVLSAKRFHSRPEITVDVATIRQAARDEQAIHIHYGDAKGAQTERTIWPLSIIFMDQTLMLLAKCQLRQDFRAFRVDRIRKLSLTDQSFRPHRTSLLRDALATIESEEATDRPPPYRA
ncbi:helix-turn-helix transcriptional regulator [Neptunicoccus cionae]|uniref:helix-turn-helix transcriptional regulator n=1 Tax=Neptunicoccus cionae TaxID=2035344 RepID=UPI000C76F3AA|nr:YafY family protein [Amylibacter cionae]PLS20007.1 transcriptional regulator [Amylibacter cionae]